MGDIHGFDQELCRRLDQLENLHTVLDGSSEDKLILLGDYIDGGPDSRRVLEENRELVSWLRGPPCYYETGRQIFVHADVDEATGQDWKWGISESIPLNQ